MKATNRDRHRQMKFCPECKNYLYADSRTDPKNLLRLCRSCGYSEKDTQGGLVMETIVQQRASESHKILLNEFTRQDPTLPHITTLPCPNQQCSTNVRGEPRDVVYIKSDTVNLKFIYICLKCDTEWRTRS
jgi:DNA-directed RNA polymerase subunit M/transcription elongation factor TFIIS